MPHPSYDLDGDGIVDYKDYFLAKRFDIDHDGRLNTGEKQTALKALEDGYENQFYWKVEETGAQRGKRLLQVRGQFVDAEDFLPVARTYPQHPLSQVPVAAKTAVELKEMRKTDLMEKFKKTKEDWDKTNPASVPQHFILSEFLVDHPQFVLVSSLDTTRWRRSRRKSGSRPESPEVSQRRRWT